MFDVSSSLRRQLNTINDSNTKDINIIRWEGQETKHIVFLTLSATLPLHLPLIIITNLIVIVTFYYCKILRTPDNHILAGLAVSDFFSGVTGIPILVFFNFNNAYFLRTKELCFLRHIILPFNNCLNLSIFTLLTIDRFLAIRRPFLHIKHIHNETVIKTMVACCIFQSLHFLCMALLFRYDYSDKDLFTRCHYATNFPLWISTYLVGTITLIQLIICLFCTANVAVTLWKKLTALKSIPKDEYLKKMASAKITTILMFMYFCLYAPSILLLFIGSLSYSTRDIIAVIIDHLRYANSWVNAFIYAFSRKAYKVAYKHILTHWPNEWSDVVYKLRTESQIVSSITPSRKADDFADSMTEKELSLQDTRSDEKEKKTKSNTQCPIDKKHFLEPNEPSE